MINKPRIWYDAPTQRWCCAEPKMLIHGGSYKKYGIIGSGNTPKEAFFDYREYHRIADLVASIY